MHRRLTAALAFVSLAGAAAAPAADFTEVDQGGADAAAISDVLARITLPPGFPIGLYAVVPGARHIAVAPDGRPRLRRHPQHRGLGGHRPRQGRHRRRGARPRAGLAKAIPNGPCFAARRHALRRRAQPRAGVSGRGGQLRRAPTSPPTVVVAAGRARSRTPRTAQPQRPRLHGRPRRQALRLARPAATTCRRPTSSTSTTSRASAASSG